MHVEWKGRCKRDWRGAGYSRIRRRGGGLCKIRTWFKTPTKATIKPKTDQNKLQNKGSSPLPLVDLIHNVHGPAWSPSLEFSPSGIPFSLLENGGWVAAEAPHWLRLLLGLSSHLQKGLPPRIHHFPSLVFLSSPFSFHDLFLLFFFIPL